MVVLAATLSSAVELPMAGLPLPLVQRLTDVLAVRNPAWLQAVKRGARTWGLAEWLCPVREERGRLLVPRGAGSVLRGLCAELGHTLEVTDARVSFPRTAWLCDVQLRDYQEAAVQAIVARQQGLVVLGTGGGKTVTGVASIARHGQPTLILVHTRDLLDQWVETVRRVLGVEAGVVGGGKAEWAPITVATLQTLDRMQPLELEARLKAFGALYLDEAHHVPARTFEAVVGACPAKYRIGFTATPNRDDGLGPLVEWTFGPRLAEVGAAQLIEAGHLESPRIVEVESGYQFEYSGPQDWQRLLEDLTTDPARNAVIADLVVREARAGHRVLVLSGRVEHCLELGRLVADEGVEALVVTAQTTTAKARREAIERFRSGALPVLVASTLADEGLDVPCVDRCVLAFPSRSASRTAQRLGRILRRAPGKGQPVLYDVVDRDVGPLRAQAAKRRRAIADVLGLELPGRSRRSGSAGAARAA